MNLCHATLRNPPVVALVAWNLDEGRFFWGRPTLDLRLAMVGFSHGGRRPADQSPLFKGSNASIASFCSLHQVPLHLCFCYSVRLLGLCTGLPWTAGEITRRNTQTTPYDPFRILGRLDDDRAFCGCYRIVVGQQTMKSPELWVGVSLCIILPSPPAFSSCRTWEAIEKVARLQLCSIFIKTVEDTTMQL